MHHTFPSVGPDARPPFRKEPGWEVIAALTSPDSDVRYLTFKGMLIALGTPAATLNWELEALHRPDKVMSERLARIVDPTRRSTESSSCFDEGRRTNGY